MPTATTIETGLGVRLDLVMAAGATNRWRVAAYQLDGDGAKRYLDLTGWTGKAQFRRSASADTAWLTVVPTLDASGGVTLTVPAAATQDDAWQSRAGVWDVEVADPNGDVWRVAYGAFTFLPQVTR